MEASRKRTCKVNDEKNDYIMVLCGGNKAIDPFASDFLPLKLQNFPTRFYQTFFLGRIHHLGLQAVFSRIAVDISIKTNRRMIKFHSN